MGHPALVCLGPLVTTTCREMSVCVYPFGGSGFYGHVIGKAEVAGLDFKHLIFSQVAIAVYQRDVVESGVGSGVGHAPEHG